MSNPHDQKKLLESRRQVEDRIIAMEHSIKDSANTLQKARFELSTTEKIEQRQKSEMLQKLQDEGKYELYYRRQNLAALYNNELQNWKQEVLSKEETIEERKERIMKKAYALRDERESGRAAFVEQAYKRQWRDSNDDSRTLNSEALTKYMAAERQKQMQDKIAAATQGGVDETAFIAEWQRQLDAAAAKDKAKTDYRHDMNILTAKGIKEQIEYNNSQKQIMYDNTRREAEEEIRFVQQAIGDEKAKIEKKKTNAYQIGQNILKYNARFKDIAAIKAQTDAEQDNFLLEHALAKEKAEVDAEKAKKRAAGEADKQYTAYLKMMMVKEAEDTGFVDEMNRREAEKVAKARDDALQAREDARNHLMKLVKEGRVEQIQYKKDLAVREKEEDRIYASKFAGDIVEGKLVDARAAEERKTQAMDNSVKLRKQMQAREDMKVLLKQDEFLAEKRMIHMERTHKARLAQQAGDVRIDYKRRVTDKLV